MVYDDGDEEELEYKELEKILVDASVAEQVKSAAKATKKRPLANADSDAKRSVPDIHLKLYFVVRRCKSDRFSVNEKGKA